MDGSALKRNGRCLSHTSGWLMGAIAVLVLSACDSDDPPPAPSIQGVVADGYLVGARVCLDVDGDSLCDAGEPGAVSTAGGIYRISAAPDLADSRQIIAEVPATAIDEDTGMAVGSAYRLAAPAGRHAVINPVTTLVVEQMRAQGQSESAAAAALATALQVSDPATLFADYAVAGASSEQRALHNFARVAARSLATDSMNFSTALGGDVPDENARDIFTAVSGNLLRQAAAIRAQVAATSTATELAAVPLQAVAVDANSIGRAMLDARFAATTDAAAELTAGLCAVTPPGTTFEGRCNTLADGVLVTDYEAARSGANLEVTAPVVRFEGYGFSDGNWISFDKSHRPAAVAGNVLSLRDHADLPGSESWEISVQAIGGQPVADVLDALFDEPVAVDARFPDGARLYRVLRRSDYGERLQISAARAVVATTDSALDGFLASYAAGNGGDDWAADRLIYGPVSGCCILGLWAQDEMQFAAENRLVRRNNNFFAGGMLTALPDGQWQRTTEAGADVVLAFDAQGNRLATLVSRNGYVHSASRLPAEQTVETFYLFDRAAYAALKGELCPQCDAP